MAEKQVALDVRGLCKMIDTHNWLVARNFESRLQTCMPWQNGEMTHLLKQFTMFKTIDSLEDTEKADYVTKYKDQNARVSKCDFGQNEIGFLSAACWHDDAEMVLLQPRYKFNTMVAPNKQVCTITHRLTGGTIQIYEEDLANRRSALGRVNFVPQGGNVKQSTECKYLAKDPSKDWVKYLGIVGYMMSLKLPDKTYYKKIQFYDYTIVPETTECDDFVSHSCIDNVYSFYGKACTWVSASKKTNGLLLSTLLEKWPTEYQEAFFAYGGGNFAMRMSNVHNIDLTLTQRSGYGTSKAQWYAGDTQRLKFSSVLYVSERTGFSCSGCSEYALAPDPAAAFTCGTPRPCIKCKAWQRVVSGSPSICSPPFPLRSCVDCGQHEQRSGVESRCDACPALEPMRRVGACSASVYCGDEKCTECNHTQYFEKTSAQGCLYLMSVADGLTFTGGVLFNRAYVDQYKPAGSTRAPEAVPALHYRNLMPDGTKWDQSTIASKCEHSLYFDNTYPGISTRNMYGSKLKYRSWCGHEQMVKDNNAQLQMLGRCYWDFFQYVQWPFNVLYPNMISLRDLNNMASTVLQKARVHLSDDNSGPRVAEIKLTHIPTTFSPMEFGNLNCHYEIRREGRTDDCTYCNGTYYTKDCGPTYHASLGTPASTGPGTCEKCEPQCVNPEHFFSASEFSCWSNGTGRVSGSASYGSVTSIGEAMSTTRNYWYKPAACVACAKLTVASVPQIVTRCGNKVTFEVWHPTQTILVLQVSRPRRRVCCAIDSVYTASSAYNSNLGVRCVVESEVGALDMTILTGGTTPLCQTFVPDLSTASVPFCPPGWFFDSAACAGTLEAWSQKCCSPCSGCATAGAGFLKTNQWKLCSGDTAADTQAAGCVTSCAEKNYQVGNDSCVECESCG